MRVGIVGCGYLGIAVGRQLQSAGHDVIGVRRSDAGLEKVAAAGLEAVQADATDPASLDAIPDVGWLVVAVSSDDRGATAARTAYVDGLRTTVDAFESRRDPPDRLVYTSSTGVFGDRDGRWVDETSAPDRDTDRRAALADAERVTLDRPATIDPTVVRLAGLYGPGRYRLSRYLDGPVPPGWRNHVHRDDAAGAVAHLLTADAGRDRVVQVVDDEPVDRWAFADWLADACGVARPPKRDTATGRAAANKRCSNDRLRGLGYDLDYPTFRTGYRAAVRAYRAGDPVE